jgi:gliding motility-associated-like protein
LVALDSTINTSYSISVSEDQIGVEKTFVVKTKGQYGCSELLTANQLPHPLINFSQEISIAALDSIADTLAPCPPKLNIIGQTGCVNNQNNVQKVLYWKPVLDFGCETDIKEYQLVAYDNEATIITTTTDTFAVETNSIRFDRCFKVRAVSQKNIKSSWSNIQCFLDVCENYELPNLFTPNGDGYNDVFEPIPFPSPTAAFNIKIYNRFGTKVFETNNPQINWTGEGLPEGLYYYLAEITFLTQSETGQEAGRKKVIKSWVQLLR